MAPRTTDQWDASLYDADHAFVYEYSEDLVEVLAPDPAERVLDLGCGTGHLTNRIAAAGAEVVGADSSREMIEAAKSDFPGLSFVHADARALPFNTAFDAVFSNAMLHWVDEDAQSDVLESVAATLRTGGRFVAELGGRGNVARIINALQAELDRLGYSQAIPWFFPSIAEYTTLLEAHGFEVRSAKLFDRPTQLDGGVGGLRNWLDMFGQALLDPLPAADRDLLLTRVETRLRPTLFEDGTWVADYRRLRVVATRVR